MNNIEIKNASIHNLKNISVTLPKHKIVVVTGVSGSGKSSLVFDILFEEGRKRYLESLGMTLDLDEKHFESITGISPTVAVKQSTVKQSNPRSTVGTRTNIINLLTLLYAREGLYDVDYFGDERIEPSFFSYNAPNGACMTCGGRGSMFRINTDALIDDQTTVAEFFEKIATTPGRIRYLANHYPVEINRPFNEASDKVKHELLYGSIEPRNGRQRFCAEQILQSRRQRGEYVDDLYHRETCPDCNGSRLGEEATYVFIKGKTIDQLCHMTLIDLKTFLQSWSEGSEFGLRLCDQVVKQLDHLIALQLGHLILYREMPSLSGGELQRLFLANHLDSSMEGIIYIFDEPTSGLHEQEKERLLAAIKQLSQAENSVIMVEHDPSAMAIADQIIDIGPYAGVAGGEIVFQGTFAAFQHSDTVSARHLNLHKQTSKKRSLTRESLTILDGSMHNLKHIDVSIPLNVMVGIAGVSGSGKSSLITHTLLPQLRRQFNTSTSTLKGFENINGFVEVNQSPIGRNANSIPITYLGEWDKIRALFAEHSDLTPSDFSFNAKGACATCGGSGQVTIWLGQTMSFTKTCRECEGKRFNEETLQALYKGKTINDVLDMSVSDACGFFDTLSLPRLQVLNEIGMGYIKLGQPTPTLSGGEAQRIKLAKEIGTQRKQKMLYVLDEPTNGLSQYDTALLLNLLQKLVDQGNSVLVVEHDLDVLRACDYILELGPEGGANGGYLIAEGSVDALKHNQASVIGRYL